MFHDSCFIFSCTMKVGRSVGVRFFNFGRRETIFMFAGILQDVQRNTESKTSNVEAITINGLRRCRTRSLNRESCSWLCLEKDHSILGCTRLEHSEVQWFPNRHPHPIPHPYLEEEDENSGSVGFLNLPAMATLDVRSSKRKT